MFERFFFSTDELVAKAKIGGIFTYDVESFGNYFLVAFRDYDTGKYAWFEAKNDEIFEGHWLEWMADNFTLVGFNCLSYDHPMISAAAAGLPVSKLKELTNALIVQNLRISDAKTEYGFELLKVNQIDLIEVAPLSGSLKMYAARMHCRQLQDLPYNPDSMLTGEQIATVRDYCFGDLDNTQLLLTELEPSLRLRASLSEQFGRDFRSLSDAQMAQAIINNEIARVTGSQPKRPDFKKQIGNKFLYKPPAYIDFFDKHLKQALVDICEAEIEIGPTGHVICPEAIDGRKVHIGGKIYSVGIGGLHSIEKCQALTATKELLIIDRDVTGYYPNLILKNRFAPEHLGEAFLEAYQAIVTRRTEAKRDDARKAEADGLKIASNGTFGKTSDPYSTLYSPRMMVQTTLTGQLSLLMAIEWLTNAGFEVVSANTDGIVTLCHSDRYAEFEKVFKAWEKQTSLETEETRYAGLYSRDVNNYIAVKPDGKTKAKGTYSEFGSALNSPLSKNPEYRIAIDAALAMLTKGTSIEETIRGCTDIKRFVTARTVNGGAAKDGRYLGKVVRWYYAKGIKGSISRCATGHNVPLTEGGKPCMLLPTVLPDDIDYDRYIDIATSILEAVGFQQRRNAQLTIF